MYQASSIFRNVGVFCSYKFSMKTARLATTLGSLCRDWFGVHYHPISGALRAVCRASRVHVPCAMRYFYSSIKREKQAAGRNSLVYATLRLRTRVRAPACVPFFFFFPVCFVHVLVFFLPQLLYRTFFSHFFLLMSVFFSHMLYGTNVSIYLFGTAPPAPTRLAFPEHGQL